MADVGLENLPDEPPGTDDELTGGASGSDCPFCEYADGTAVPEGGLLFDGGTVIAFRPLRPFTPGHTLVVPRPHVESFLDADPVTSEAVMAVARLLGRRKGPDGVNVITSAGRAATQTVLHWHVHLIPRQEGDRLGGWPWKPPKASKPSTGGIDIHISHPPRPAAGYSRLHLEEAFEAGRRRGRAGR